MWESSVYQPHLGRSTRKFYQGSTLALPRIVVGRTAVTLLSPSQFLPMVFCDIPRCPNIDDTPRLKTSPPSNGDIVLAHVSPTQPITAIIRMCMRGTTEADEAHNLEISLRSRSVISQSNRHSGQTGIVRHAVIVLVTTSVTLPEAQFYVITTVGGSDSSTYPNLLKRFLIPICTTTRDEKHIRHLHITPTWQDVGKPIWVIAYPYPAGKITLENRWVDGQGDRRTNYSLDEKALEALDRMCSEEMRKFESEKISVQQGEVDEYSVSLILLVFTNKYSKLYSALGEGTL